MRRLLIAIILAMALPMPFFGTVSAAAAESRSFPYEAVVSAEQMYVRSGPGPKYYPTSKLRRGERVLVHRHDPGGWFMIAPPPGSFSWILSKYVRRIDNDRGVVTVNNVIVRVGSFESDNTRDLYQRKLSEGDEVRILDEKVLTGDAGKSEPWFRIEPPRSEWRWVMGKHLSVVAPGTDPSAGRGDPFDGRVGEQPSTSSTPAKPRMTLKISSPATLAGSTVPATHAGEYDPAASEGLKNQFSETPLIRKQAAPLQKPAADFEQEEIARLDARLQGILDQTPLEWEFESVIQDYRALRARASQAIYQTMIDSRLSLIDQKLIVKARHLEIQRLGEETLRRDAELAAQQREHESRLLGAPRRAASPFDGAGIVQRSAADLPQAPRYVLLAPNGRVLTYLQPGAGVDLDAWVSKSAGVYGVRSYRNDLRADLLIVNALSPVRLAQ